MRIEPAGDREIVITREFAAPIRLVFDAHTKPELVSRWLGPHDWQVETAEIDLRVGGAWRYHMRGPDGAEMTLRGTYLEIVAPERLVTTESNPDCHARAGHESVNTLVLVELDGRTHLTNTVRFPSRDVRDGVLGSGMERGVAQGFDRLDVLLTRRPEQAPPRPPGTVGVAGQDENRVPRMAADETGQRRLRSHPAS